MKTLIELKKKKELKAVRIMHGLVGKEYNQHAIEEVKIFLKNNGYTFKELKENSSVITVISINENIENIEYIDYKIYKDINTEIEELKHILNEKMEVVSHEYKTTNENDRYNITFKVKNKVYEVDIIKNKNKKELHGTFILRSKDSLFNYIDDNNEYQTLYGNELKADNLIKDSNSNIIGLLIKDYDNNVIGQYNFN